MEIAAKIRDAVSAVARRHGIALPFCSAPSRQEIRGRHTPARARLALRGVRGPGKCSGIESRPRTPLRREDRPMIDRELVTRKVLLIGKDLEELRKLVSGGLGEEVADPPKEVLAERFLERTITRVIDVNYHLI